MKFNARLLVCALLAVAGCVAGGAYAFFEDFPEMCFVIAAVYILMLVGLIMQTNRYVKELHYGR